MPFNLILTLRGAIVLLFAIYLLLGPVNQTDIVASVVSFSLFGIVASCFLVTLISGLIFKRSFEVSVVPPLDEGAGVEAGKAARLVIRTSEIRVQPLWAVWLHLSFEHEIETALHELRGFERKARTLYEDLKFPHRGYWLVQQMAVVVGDRFGLTQFCFGNSSEQVKRAVCVEPPQVSAESLPILTSCQRSGDEVSDANERRGDPYDLKPYHPADGMKKILWKVFAKSGQLISRHPERAMTPEGQVALYVMAKSESDDVCGLALAYFARLSELDLEVFLGCDGMGEQDIASKYTDAKELLIESAWESERSFPGKELQYFLDRLGRKVFNSSIEQVILFVPSREILSAQELKRVIAVGGILEEKNIKPVFFLSAWPYQIGAVEHRPTWSKSFKEMLFHGNAHHKLANAAHYQEFMRSCADRNWAVNNLS